MTDVGSVYGNALYTLARDESMSASVLEELTVLEQSFRQEPGFLRLLSTPALSKEERCKILDDSFRGKVQPYVLNFLKILTEKGYIRQFALCCEQYRELYNQDNGILPVKAVTAVALTDEQQQKLCVKLQQMTGKTVEIENQVDPGCLGGVRLDYEGMRVEDTVQHRLDAVAALLKNTML
jgi:F-type H+-transporting ATPase subunit delta